MTMPIPELCRLLLTENDLKNYWKTGDAVEKALIDGSVKIIMTKFNFVDEVNIILPYDKHVYEINVIKSELEKFIGKDFNVISGNLDELFSNQYVYSKKGRQSFFGKFGKIK